MRKANPSVPESENSPPGEPAKPTPQSPSRGRLSPSAYLRQRRPELYSDSAQREAYVLDRRVFDHHLDTLTSRNETHDFELFSRKLCERTICPNLRPNSGPEGGGDSKVDTETIPVSDEVASTYFVGLANSGKERWAFAFSAKRTWKQKVRGDVAGIVGTGRGYQRIYCVTSRYARAADRAALEKELSEKYGVPVTILDRSWIIEEVIDQGRKDIAFNYLHVGELTQGARLGPNDFSRQQVLEDIEKEIDDLANFQGAEMQLASEALVAAKMSRNLERPRTETDGRFARAIRLADRYGTARQQVDARYEATWTAFWYFDDLDIPLLDYDEFEARASTNETAHTLELVGNLFQLLTIEVRHAIVSADDAKLVERGDRLVSTLQVVVDDRSRPNAALEAKVSQLTVRLNLALIAEDSEAVSALWSALESVLDEARALGEFDAHRLLRMIEAFGEAAGSDPGYTSLVEATSTFVAERTSEGEGARVLLRRAQQLGNEDIFDVIRLLGRAARLLTKKEYAGELIEAMQQLGIAYRAAGLFWAARASFMFAAAAILIEAEADGRLQPQIIPTLKTLAWILLQLRHMPDFIETVQLMRGAGASLTLNAEQRRHFARSTQELDLAMASQLLNITDSELGLVQLLPDLLDAAGLIHSRSALLYRLGYETELRAEGSIPETETPRQVLDLYNRAASQPVSDEIWGPLLVNDTAPQSFATKVLGVEIAVEVEGTMNSILVAEAVLGTIEAYFATTLELRIHPHAESVNIQVRELDGAVEPVFQFSLDTMSGDLVWPKDVSPAQFGFQERSVPALLGIAGEILTSISIIEDAEETIATLRNNEAVAERVMMISVASNSRSRAFGETVRRLDYWPGITPERHAVRPVRPQIRRTRLPPVPHEDADKEGEEPASHRGTVVRSIINPHLWDRAGWLGAGYIQGLDGIPTLALLFTDRDAAEKIFQAWRERFGAVDVQQQIYIAIVTGVDAANPAAYDFVLTSAPPRDEEWADGPVSFTKRGKRMEPATNAGLQAFISSYRQSGQYRLMPAILTSTGQPELLERFAIQKSHVSIKSVDEIGPRDFEQIALEHGRE